MHRLNALIAFLPVGRDRLLLHSAEPTTEFTPATVGAAAWALDDPSLTDRLQNLPSPYGDGSAGTLIAALAVELADRGPRSDGNERFRRCQPLFGSGRRV